MLTEFRSIWNGHPAHVSVAMQRIKLVNEKSQPLHSAPYRAGPERIVFKKIKLEIMFPKKIIEPAQTGQTAPIAIAFKKDGKLRFCVDYHKLSSVIKRDSYSIPRKDEIIDIVGEATIFSTLEANSRYQQAEIDDTCSAALTSRQGLYRFTRMPFGLRNTSDTFQHTMSFILFTV